MPRIATNDLFTTRVPFSPRSHIVDDTINHDPPISAFLVLSDFFPCEHREISMVCTDKTIFSHCRSPCNKCTHIIYYQSSKLKRTTVYIYKH